MINFSVPAMYSETHLNELNKMNEKSKNNRRIREVYGSIPSAPVGTIRPSITLPNKSLNDLCSYIKRVNYLGMEFNYIMNSTVLDGSEYTKEGKKEIIDFIDVMVNAGLNSITITVPFIIRLVRKYFPKLNITASICAEIESVQRAMDFAELGVTSIVPAKDLNRDFKTLSNIKNLFQGEIKLLCTTPCIFKCSDLYYHMNLSSIRDNALEASLKVKGKFLSHTASRCQRRRLEKLEEYIKSPWIRPEDIENYEKIGINEFKLDGRDKTEEYTLSIVNAYMEGSYSGNLLYLMQPYYPKNMEEFQRVNNFEKDFWRLGVYLDNKKLDGFISHFTNENNKCNNGCTNCNYCINWATNAIVTNKQNTSNYLSLLKKTEDEGLSIGEN